MTEFQRRLELNIRESLRFAVGKVDEDAVAHMVAGVNAVLNHPSAPAPEKHVRGDADLLRRAISLAEDGIFHVGVALQYQEDDTARRWLDGAVKQVDALRAALATTEGKGNGN
jgi:hypothetical protein